MLARTGKDWAGWFRVLDRGGAKRMDHKQIVAHLRAHHDLSPWWQQSVAVAYEQARGLRDVHEKAGGYEIGRSKTIAASLEKGPDKGQVSVQHAKLRGAAAAERMKELLES